MKGTAAARIACAMCGMKAADPGDAPCRDGLVYCAGCKGKGECGCDG